MSIYKYVHPISIDIDRITLQLINTLRDKTNFIHTLQTKEKKLRQMEGVLSLINCSQKTFSGNFESCISR